MTKTVITSNDHYKDDDDDDYSRQRNDYQLLVYDGMAIDMMMNIVTIDDN